MFFRHLHLFIKSSPPLKRISFLGNNEKKTPITQLSGGRFYFTLLYFGNVNYS